jgi:hypothetical protein
MKAVSVISAMVALVKSTRFLSVAFFV